MAPIFCARFRLLISLTFCQVLVAQGTPLDDRAILQSILDACPSDSVCELPDGVFVLSEPLRISESRFVNGAGGGPSKKPHRKRTEIRAAEGSRIPLFLIEGSESDIRVTIKDALLVGGGIHVGGTKDPCRGIDDPFDVFLTSLLLIDITIVASSLDTIFFEGGTLTMEDVKIENNIEGSGLYVANATGDIVIIDGEFDDNERWGVYVCNSEGTGQIFMNDVDARDNGRGGIAIVGKGSAPDFRTLCMQNTGVIFNKRFGILLYNVAKSLLFNVGAGFTFTEPPLFGDGIAISASDNVYFWDVQARFNERAGFSAFGPTAAELSHVHLTGDVWSLNNGIVAVVEGAATLHPHTSNTSITGLCGITAPLTAPPLDAYCEENDLEVGCGAVSVGLVPPDPTP